MKTYKFIEIREDGTTSGGHRVYGVYNKKSGNWIGSLDYYPQWEQYVLDGDWDAIWSIECLRDIIDFMENHAGKEVSDDNI